ncbi:hypothetical protein ACT17_06165 [Mycolicibacterium conceptionense]|uniref:Uncharacterized protein n=1 Tax=Mycolicibacterium conceptionense TaxID=451644 RepID=A0A0J8UGV4_9MYCO|nr:ParB N-terminal domain-containing protein [Mycolicibacterium conceptionense]KMV19625.1 hypothetical protein ACT17_06165 [Mycolicibacterium conceptionense]
MRNDPHKVRTLSARRFRVQVLPHYHRSWSRTEQEMLSDRLERARVDELVEELRTSGMESPVVVGFDHWWSPRPRVWDGMHRSIASMRLGLDIPVRYGYPEESDYDHGDVYGAVSDTTDLDTLTDAIMSVSSFRLPAGHRPWIQTDLVSGSRAHGAELYLPRHPELREAIAAELQERLLAAGVTADVTFLRYEPGDD